MKINDDDGGGGGGSSVIPLLHRVPVIILLGCASARRSVCDSSQVNNRRGKPLDCVLWPQGELVRYSAEEEVDSGWKRILIKRVHLKSCCNFEYSVYEE